MSRNQSSKTTQNKSREAYNTSNNFDDYSEDQSNDTESYPVKKTNNYTNQKNVPVKSSKSKVSQAYTNDIEEDEVQIKKPITKNYSKPVPQKLSSSKRSAPREEYEDDNNLDESNTDYDVKFPSKSSSSKKYSKNIDTSYDEEELDVTYGVKSSTQSYPSKVNKPTKTTKSNKIQYDEDKMDANQTDDYEVKVPSKNYKSQKSSNKPKIQEYSSDQSLTESSTDYSSNAVKKVKSKSKKQPYRESYEEDSTSNDDYDVKVSKTSKHVSIKTKSNYQPPVSSSTDEDDEEQSYQSKPQNSSYTKVRNNSYDKNHPDLNQKSTVASSSTISKSSKKARESYDDSKDDTSDYPSEKSYSNKLAVKPTKSCCGNKTVCSPVKESDEEGYSPKKESDTQDDTSVTDNYNTGLPEVATNIVECSVDHEYVLRVCNIFDNQTSASPELSTMLKEFSSILKNELAVVESTGVLKENNLLSLFCHVIVPTALPPHFLPQENIHEDNGDSNEDLQHPQVQQQYHQQHQQQQQQHQQQVHHQQQQHHEQVQQQQQQHYEQVQQQQQQHYEQVQQQHQQHQQEVQQAEEQQVRHAHHPHQSVQLTQATQATEHPIQQSTQATQPIHPVQQSTQATQPIHPVQHSVQHSVQQPIHPVQQPIHPVQQPIHPVQQPTQPIHPVQQPIHPVQQPIHPVQQPTQVRTNIKTRPTTTSSDQSATTSSDQSATTSSDQSVTQKTEKYLVQLQNFSVTYKTRDMILTTDQSGSSLVYNVSCDVNSKNINSSMMNTPLVLITPGFNHTLSSPITTIATISTHAYCIDADVSITQTGNVLTATLLQENASLTLNTLGDTDHIAISFHAFVNLSS
jgi:hypothetical protein